MPQDNSTEYDTGARACICFLTTGYATLRVCRPGGQCMARDIIIWSLGALGWPHVGLGRDEDSALGRDGPFGPDSSNAFED